MNTTQIRVRIAPSPTGTLHIGTARTAMFNFLFARHHKGKMVLRIEDTDLKRSSNEYIDNIIRGLKWLGIEYDEGPDIGGEYEPYVQSQRSEIYKKHLQILEEKGFVYPCFCSDEDLEAERKMAEKNNVDYKYSGKCKNLTKEKKLALINSNKPFTLRFIVLAKTIIVKDLIRGEVSFDTSLIGDFVVKKTDGTPTYNFAVVIDDITMKITHIIRGDDIFSNTPKQILIYEALNLPLPQFAHISMILAKDRSKLSKRHGATSLEEYKSKGYLKSALINYLALLGWSSANNKEIFSVNELTELFTLERVAKSPAIFDIDKLNWLNGYYIKNLPEAQLIENLVPYLKKDGLDVDSWDVKKLKDIASLVRERIHVFSDASKEIDYLFNEPAYNEEIINLLKTDPAPEILKTVLNSISSLDEWNTESIHHALEVLIKEKGIKTKQLLQTARSALTGTTSGPDLPKVMCLLGKDTVIKRINNFI